MPEIWRDRGISPHRPGQPGPPGPRRTGPRGAPRQAIDWQPGRLRPRGAASEPVNGLQCHGHGGMTRAPARVAHWACHWPQPRRARRAAVTVPNAAAGPVAASRAVGLASSGAGPRTRSDSELSGPGSSPGTVRDTTRLSTNARASRLPVSGWWPGPGPPARLRMGRGPRTATVLGVTVTSTPPALPGRPGSESERPASEPPARQPAAASRWPPGRARPGPRPGPRASAGQLGGGCGGGLRVRLSARPGPGTLCNSRSD